MKLGNISFPVNVAADDIVPPKNTPDRVILVGDKIRACGVAVTHF